MLEFTFENVRNTLNRFFGLLAGQFLDGKFGAKIDPHLSALLYAGDRFEARGEIESALVKGQIVLADRYAASNLAHQTARVPPAQRADFIRWLTKLEFQIYGIPPEDLVIFLRVPVRHAQHLVGTKKGPSLHQPPPRHPGSGSQPSAHRLRDLRKAGQRSTLGHHRLPRQEDFPPRVPRSAAPSRDGRG
jgi:hypothetical protein